jgi:secretion/DNA translocation related TadE-like protein
VDRFDSPPKGERRRSLRRTGSRVAADGRGGRDRGAASLWLLAIGLLIVAAGLAGAAVGAARVGRHEARVAADLGALAGAMRAIEGEPVACDRAAQLAAANRARLVDCRLDGLDLIVRVEVAVIPLRGLSRTATAAARAGPVRVP